MSNVPDSQRQGLSEDEGRARISRTAWKRRGSAWLHGVQHPSQTHVRRRSRQEVPDRIRPPNLRRLTHLGSSNNQSTRDGTPSARRQRYDPAARWRQIKAGLKLIGQKKKNERGADYVKSAELMAGLLAGSPAALILASNFQRDEHGTKKVPVLLEQLKFRITDSESVEESTDRHQRFRIELEYGNGDMRMQWVIWRYLSDFFNLHASFKVQTGTERLRLRSENPNRSKLPRFPRSAFPVMRNWRGITGDEEFDDDPGAESETDANANNEGSQRPSEHRKRRTHSRQVSRASVGFATGANEDPQSGVPPTPGAEGPSATARKEIFPERQRRKLEIYLRELIRYFTFRTGSNRLCRFLEISALGINLAAEGSYHGKEGMLSVASGRGLDLGRNIKSRWFLVRQSYIVCVQSLEETILADVFLVDPDFTMQARRPRIRDQKKAKEIAKTAKSSAAHPKHHLLTLSNSERKMILFARNERQQDQFAESISFMMENTAWFQRHRFDSFAPARHKVKVEWLVDARNYMWKLSRALDMAENVIYIHDWWLSPELYLRRPPAISHKWRIDRLLKRKAEQGVKVYIIMYRNINSAIPIESEHSKTSLLDLHPNINVLRSPNQVRQKSFFWAHHEKVCVVDHIVAFCGGVDLCFGRWDTPEHRVVDDKPTGFEPSEFPRDGDHCQQWPGKDYSNPRVLDFFKLEDPYGEMYDRTKTPRMPWHDIGMQMLGQPARDLARHFVQRWNYLLRQRKHTRPIPVLLPPPDFIPPDLEKLGLTGSCDVQILRSACEWSIGTSKKTEHSIMNAYIKLIEASQHFIYIENQFFITSCDVDGTKISNLIGDALVERIIRAHDLGEAWRAIVMIPLMPGFQNPIHTLEASSVRLIMQCQYRSINRTETSIYSRLRARGITPEDYITFYSLRAWGKIGPTKALVSEQLYIHAKCLVADDRYAIIGSANINERSMLGSRDSEVASLVFDDDMIDSQLGGEQFRVGRFPHTLRMRLMREHLGIDVESIDEAVAHGQTISSEDVTEARRSEMSSSQNDEYASEIKGPAAAFDHARLNSNSKTPTAGTHGDAQFEFQEETHWPTFPAIPTTHLSALESESKGQITRRGSEGVHSNAQNVSEQLTPSSSSDQDIVSKTYFGDSNKSQSIGAKSTIESSLHGQPKPSDSLPPPPPPPVRFKSSESGLPATCLLPPLPTTDDADIGGPPLRRVLSKISAEHLYPLFADMRMPYVDKDCMKDPVMDDFFQEVWHAVAENNTKVFRHVFRCQPDDAVTNWDDYHLWESYHDRFNSSQGLERPKEPSESEAQRRTGPPGSQITDEFKCKASNKPLFARSPGNGGKKQSHPLSEKESVMASLPGSKDNQDQLLTQPLDEKSNVHFPDDQDTARDADHNALMEDHANLTIDTAEEKSHTPNGSIPPPASSGVATKRRRRATTKSSGTLRSTDPVLSKSDAEELLKLVQGHVVVFPLNW